MASTSMLDAALTYARTLGWSVHPVNRKKIPVTEHGRNDATRDEATIREYFKNGAQIGVATGPESDLFVLDVDVKPEDGRDGRPLLARLTQRYGELPRTPRQRTGSGGEQYLFRYIEGLKNSQDKLGAGLDTRGKGGYIVVAPSQNTSGPYEWIVSPDDAPLADVPEWLIDLMAGPGVAQSTYATETDADPFDAAMDPQEGTDDPAVYWLSRALVRAGSGSRNETGFWLACQLRDAGLTRDAAEQVMREYTERAPLKGHPYTISEALASLAQAFREAPRGPASSTGSPSSTNGTGPHTEAHSQPPPTDAAPAAAAVAASPFHCTDLGNAQRLAYLHGQNIRYVPRWGRWLLWDGTRWAEDELRAVVQIARDVPKAIYQEAAAAPDDTTRKALGAWAVGSESRFRLTAAVNLLETEPGIPVRYATLDNDAWALNCLNGTLDLRGGQLRPHQRSDLITKCVNVAYDPAAYCPRWLAFLDRVFAHNADMIAFIQRAIGYTLTADVSEQCLFFAYGTGKNGKSTFFNVLLGLLGEYGQQAPSELILIKQHDNVPADVARLVGARLAVTSELEHGRRLAESKVKDLTGGDRLVARFMRQDFFEFTSTHKLWIYGNHKPVIRGSDEGIWRRIRLVPFTVTIPPEERDPHLVQTLLAELPGILAWAVQGCLDWRRSGLREPTVVVAATAEYRTEMDLLGPFLTECCEIGPRYEATVAELYNAYKLWCIDNEEELVKNRTFSDMLTERGMGMRRDMSTRWRTGLRLKKAASL